MKTPFAILLLGILLIVGSTSIASAQVIYSDPLTGNNPIAGTTPGGTNPGNATWNATYYDAPFEGSQGANSFSGGYAQQAAAFLPLTLDGTGIYTLSATVTVDASSANSIEFGFVGDTSQTNQATLDNATPEALLTFSDVGAISSYGDDSATASALNFSLGTPTTFSILVNSHNGTVSFEEGGTVFETVNDALTPAQLGSITGIGLSFDYSPSDSLISDLSLSEATTVPEASTWSLLLSGTLLLASFRLWRKRRITLAS